MNYADLPSPGILNGGFRLRLDCARAISAVEILAQNGAAGEARATELAAFFTECAERCTAAIPVPVDPDPDE